MFLELPADHDGLLVLLIMNQYIYGREIMVLSVDHDSLLSMFLIHQYSNGFDYVDLLAMLVNLYVYRNELLTLMTWPVID